MTLVAEAMNRTVVAVSPEASAAEAAALARRERSEHLLVLDGGILVGILCTCDLEGAGAEDKVAERMSLPVLTVRPDATLDEAAITLAECEVGCLAVACGGLVLGTLGEEELARAGGRRPGKHHHHRHGGRGASRA